MPGSFIVSPPTGSPGVAADATSLANTPLVSSICVYNGATMDMLREAYSDALAAAGILGAAQLQFNGATFDRRRVPNVFKIVTAVAITAATGATIWTPASGKKFRFMGASFSVSAAAALRFWDGAAAETTEFFKSPLLASAGIYSTPDIGNGYLSAIANNILTLDVSASATVSGTVWGCEE